MLNDDERRRIWKSWRDAGGEFNELSRFFPTPTASGAKSDSQHKADYWRDHFSSLADFVAATTRMNEVFDTGIVQRVKAIAGFSLRFRV